MDGTLLNSNSELLPSSVEALRMATDRGVQVILATGKARPAAMKALERVGLADNTIVGVKTPGIFLQGLQVYGRNGCLLGGGSLGMPIVQNVLSYAVENDVSVTCFLGDECVSPKITRELEELHYRYYEPYPRVLSIEDIIKGPAVCKMLLMQDAESIRALRKIMDEKLVSTNAGTMQAVDTMLEIVPRGFNKWTALQLLLSHLDGVESHHVMAIGDGENDLEMIQGAGVGVAMGNAVAVVKNSADIVVSSNDDGGIYEAIERYILHSET
jgi:Cof subfamily protein (haloacid dehalogenase superfamily)